MSRVYNFSAGPAALPEPVLKQIRDDIPDWQGTGMSVMEVSHRGKDFVALAARAEGESARTAGHSDGYSVLFTQGGATLQMSMVPLNLTAPGDTVDYVITEAGARRRRRRRANFADR